MGALIMVACSKDESTPPVEVDPPVVSGVSATIVSPGDTLVISGSHFSAVPAENSVKFSNPLASTPAVAATATELTVVVDADATSGPFTVTTNGAPTTGPALEVRRGIGDVFVFGGLGDNQALTLPNPTATTQYLVIPLSVNSNVSYLLNHSYSIASNLALPIAATRPAVASVPRRKSTIREEFEAWRWEQARELVERAGFPRAEETPALRTSSGLPVRQFNVLKTTTGSVSNPASYQHVTAQLRFAGTKCLIYSDIDTLATGNLSYSDFVAFASAFDASIEATNVTYFGGYSDIDGNGKVIILITPVVNRMTPPNSSGFIAGFFLSIDLYSPPNVPAGTTNQGEVLYLIAADPGSFWGNPFPKAFTAQENINTTAHEHQHLISFSHRLFVEHGPSQVTWLEEGMAHMAEHLNGIDTANENRGQLYMACPDSISLEDNRAPLDQRGGIYLFLQLMVDRYGTDILKDIVQSKCTGRACIQAVTGENFYDLFAEFLAALYLTDRGITADPRFRFESINLADFGPLATQSHLTGAGSVTGSVRRTSGDFHIFSGTLNEETRFVFTNPGGSAKLRNVVVRIQ